MLPFIEAAAQTVPQNPTSTRKSRSRNLITSRSHGPGHVALTTKVMTPDAQDGTARSAYRYLRPSLPFSILHNQPCWLTAARLLTSSCFTVNNLWGACAVDQEALGVVSKLMGNIKTPLTSFQLLGTLVSQTKACEYSDLVAMVSCVEMSYMSLKPYRRKRCFRTFLYFVRLKMWDNMRRKKFILTTCHLWCTDNNSPAGGNV